MEGYKAKVVSSWKELSVKEKIAYKETDSFDKLDEIVQPDASLVIGLVNYITIHVENPKAERQEYNQYVLVADDGNCYVTSSDNFADSMSSMLDEISDAGDDIGDWKVKIYKRESKNFKGKYVLTCAIE